MDTIATDLDAIAAAIDKAEVIPPPVELITTETGRPKGCLANAITFLSGADLSDRDGWVNPWKGVLIHNEFAMRTIAAAPPPWEQPASGAWCPRPWTPADDLEATDWLQRQDCMVAPKITAAAVEAAAQRKRFHPVRQYLTPLVWDGVPRLGDWLPDFLGVENSTFARTVGERWMVSAVARIFDPGCQADSCLILEGPQGAGKSSALRILGGEWFTDDLADLSSKDASMQTAGAWIIEVSELDAFSRAEASRIKAFISRRVDRFRPPYGERLIEAPRQCVFAGTTNATSGYLQDPTGGRRFWPVRVGEIDLAGLEAARTQLWAEAVHAFRNGRTWWLDTPELKDAAKTEADNRYDSDSWEHLVACYVTGKPDVSVGEILAECINLPIDRWGKSEQTRVGKIMTALGWDRVKVSTAKGRQWRYRPPICPTSLAAVPPLE